MHHVGNYCMVMYVCVCVCIYIYIYVYIYIYSGIKNQRIKEQIIVRKTVFSTHYM